MIRFTTQYSRYEVTVRDSFFHIKKFDALHPSDAMTVGQTRVSRRMRLEKGDRASFDGWSTSEVVEILEVNG